MYAYIHTYIHPHVDVYSDKHVLVKYIPAHTGHQPGQSELKFLPLPTSIKEATACKLSQGIPSKRIIRGENMLNKVPPIPRTCSICEVKK